MPSVGYVPRVGGQYITGGAGGFACRQHAGAAPSSKPKPSHMPLLKSLHEGLPEVSLRFGYFYRKGVRVAKHVGAEDDPLLVRREADIRLQPVIVLCHIDQFLGAQHAGLPELLLVELALERDGLRAEEVDPLPVPGPRPLSRVAAIAAEQAAVARHVEVNRPLVALQVIARTLAGRHVVACQPDRKSTRLNSSHL